MAQVIQTLIVDLSGLEEQVDAAKESVLSVRAALASHRTAHHVDRALPNAAMLLDNVDDLVRCEPIDGSAGVAGKLDLFQIKPSDGYMELVAAIAAHGDEYAIRVRHGWPILSFGDRTPNVTEAGGVRNAPGGGVA